MRLLKRIRWSLQRLTGWHSLRLTDSNLPMQIGSNLLKPIHLRSLRLIGSNLLMQIRWSLQTLTD